MRGFLTIFQLVIQLSISADCCHLFRAGIFLTIPFGRFADKYGRKPILFLGLLGQILSYLWVLLVCKRLHSPSEYGA